MNGTAHGDTPGDAEPTSCENCGAGLTGPFCATCGQPRRSPITSVRAFAAATLDDIANLDSRLLRTLCALLFQPGLLTSEYLKGRRIRYTQPVTLYLLAAATFFFTASFRPFLWVDTARQQVVGALPGMTVGSDVAEQTMRELDAAGISLESFAAGFVDVVNAFLPAFLIGSVALFSLVLFALHCRREPRYLHHAIFALHWTAFYLLVLAAARLFPPGWVVQVVPLFIGILYLPVALRRVYRQPVPVAVFKGLALLFTFLVVLAAWVAAAIGVGLALT